MSVVCLLISRRTAYDSLAGLLYMLGAEMGQLGHRVHVIDLSKPDFATRFDELLPLRDDMVAVGMSGIGVDLRTADGCLLWDAIRVPFFSWYCDHPSYYVSRHELNSPWVGHGYVFRDHAEFNHKHLRGNGAAFPVHIGIPDAGFFPDARRGRRNGRILFAKSGWDPAALERQWRASLQPSVFSTLFAVIEAARATTCGALPDLITALAPEHGAFLSPGSLLFNTIFTRADNYLRAARTTAVARVLMRYPVDFVGSGWDYLQGDSGRAARLLGPVSFDALRSRLTDYLGTASINPNVDFSVHDRVFFALAAGTIPVFDVNRFSRSAMPALEPYAFEFEPESIAAAVDAALDDHVLAQEKVAATAAAMLPDYSMAGAAARIVEIGRILAAGNRAAALPASPSPAPEWRPDNHSRCAEVTPFGAG